MQCQHETETSRSNSLRALYGEGGLSRMRQCRRRATTRFTVPGQPRAGERVLCSQHASSEFWQKTCIDPWVGTSIEEPRA